MALIYLEFDRYCSDPRGRDRGRRWFSMESAVPRSTPFAAYKTLGVKPTDDFAAIRRAWLRLVKANHPDVAGGDPTRLAAINEAWDALCWHRKIDEQTWRRWRRAEARKAEARRAGSRAPTASAMPERPVQTAARRVVDSPFAKDFIAARAVLDGQPDRRTLRCA